MCIIYIFFVNAFLFFHKIKMHTEVCSFHVHCIRIMAVKIHRSSIWPYWAAARRLET